MSLRLTLMRHADSDCGSPAFPDHDRPLNARGRVAASAIGSWLQRCGYIPEIVLLSTAARVRESWDRVAAGLEAEVPLRVAPELYLAPPERILEALASETARSVLIVAHNPGLAALSQWLVAETPARVEFHDYPSGATLALSIERDAWRDLTGRCAEVADFVVPRDLISDRGSGTGTAWSGPSADC